MLKAKLGAMAASAALFASVFVPAASAANVNIGGNGAFSFNWANLNTIKSTTVSQTNTTTAVNNIGSNANSGNNSSAFNTGGASTVLSGPATSTVGTATLGGHNNALIAGCGCAADLTNVNIGGNGAFSVNGVNSTSTSIFSATQGTNTTAVNSIGSNANAGNNSSSFNTGAGSTVVGGSATSGVTTVTTGGNNNLTVTP